MTNLKRIAAAAALAVAALHAHADTTHTFTFAGEKTHFFDAWECPFPTQQCDPVYEVKPWNGHVFLTTPDGDGSFTFDQLSVRIDEGLGLTPPLTLQAFGLAPYLTATVTDGFVTALNGRGIFGGPPVGFTFSDEHLSYDFGGSHHIGPTYGQAILSEVTPIPEPGTWALLGAGLLVMTRVARRHA